MELRLSHLPRLAGAVGLSLALAIGGTAYADDDEPEAYLYEGTCATLDEAKVVDDITDLDDDDDDLREHWSYIGNDQDMPDGLFAEEDDVDDLDGGVQMLVDGDYAVVVHEHDDTDSAVLVCGDIDGDVENDSLLIELHEVDGSGFEGRAFMHLDDDDDDDDDEIEFVVGIYPAGSVDPLPESTPPRLIASDKQTRARSVELPADRALLLSGSYCMLNVHLDTDFGGDPDDFAALLMLLGMPEIRLTGITTVIDDTGLRAGAVESVLNQLGRTDIPLCAGTRVGLTTNEKPGIREDFWPGVTPQPATMPGESIGTIERSMWMRSVFTLIGPYTNGAMFERVRAGLLRERRVVHMGGIIEPPAADFPQWTAADDFNVQFDTRALQELYSSFADITMVPMPVAMNAWITSEDVDRIERSGPLGSQLAVQLRTWGAERRWSEIGLQHGAFPNELAGIMWDPLTALIATGWEGATTERMNLHPVVKDDVLYFEQDQTEGRPVDVVTSIDGPAFREIFMSAIESAQAGMSR